MTFNPTSVKVTWVTLPKDYWEKVYFKSRILVHEHWTILDHFDIPVLFASECHQHVLKNINITFPGNTSTPKMFQYSSILGRSSIWDLKYTFFRLLVLYLTPIKIHQSMWIQ